MKNLAFHALCTLAACLSTLGLTVAAAPPVPAVAMMAPVQA